MAKSKTVAVALLAAIFLLCTEPALAQEGHGQPDAAAQESHGGAHAGAHAAAQDAGHHEAGPVPPHHARWAGTMVVVILFVFLMAAAVGISTRLVAPPEEELPPTHSHDEPPGASHHHGHSGTINPEPDHGHALDHGHGQGSPGQTDHH